MAVGQNQWYHFGVGEFTTHFRTDFSGWIGMFTGGTIWILTMARKPAPVASTTRRHFPSFRVAAEGVSEQMAPTSPSSKASRRVGFGFDGRQESLELPRAFGA